MYRDSGKRMEHCLAQAFGSQMIRQYNLYLMIDAPDILRGIRMSGNHIPYLQRLENPRRKGDINMIRGHPEKQKGNRWSIRKEEQRNVAEA